jgi:hypothetical protein
MQTLIKRTQQVFFFVEKEENNSNIKKNLEYLSKVENQMESNLYLG